MTDQPMEDARLLWIRLKRAWDMRIEKGMIIRDCDRIPINPSRELLGVPEVEGEAVSEPEIVEVRSDPKLVDRVPAGYRRLVCDVYESETEVVILADPPEPTGNEEADYEAHNCDALGCSSIEHVRYRFRRPK